MTREGIVPQARAELHPASTEQFRSALAHCSTYIRVRIGELLISGYRLGRQRQSVRHRDATAAKGSLQLAVAQAGAFSRA